MMSGPRIYPLPPSPITLCPHTTCLCLVGAAAVRPLVQLGAIVASLPNPSRVLAIAAAASRWPIPTPQPRTHSHVECGPCQARAASGKAARNRVVADAVEILGTAEAHDPSCAMVHQLRGDLAHITGDMPRMVVHMRRALTNSGGSSAEVALRRLGLAVALGETGDVAGEEAECRAVLASHPGHIQARFSLGQCLSRGGQPDDAIPELMMALQLPNDDPPLHERNVRNVREAALSQICESLRERAKRQQRKADHQGAAATLERLLSVPGTDAEVRAGTQANLAVSRARLGQLAEALLAAGRGVEAASHEGCVGHPDAGVPTKVTAFAVHTLAGVREAMGDAVATTGRDPGTDAAALYLQSKGLYAQAHQICKDPATRSAHGRVQAKAHPDIEWISDESMDTGVGIHCGGTARCVGAQGASLEGLPE
jgi:tetratricopeptide (TPR) repeat protein